MVTSDSSKPFSNAPAANGGSSSVTFCTPALIVVPFSHARQPQGLYSAVETGMTFFSLPSIFTFLPPSLAKPGTGAGAGGGRLNVYAASRSRVVHAATLRANGLSSPGPKLSPVRTTKALPPFGIDLGV